MLQQDGNFGHPNVISVVASAITKQFVTLHLRGRRPLAKTPIDPGETWRNWRKLQEKNYVKKLEEASEENEYTLFNLYAHIDNQSPYLVTLHMDGVPLQMEIDTGSSISLISQSTFWWLWPNRTLEDSVTNLTMYVLRCTTSSSGYPGLSSQC